MNDDNNLLYKTFGGRNKAITVIVAFLVALAFLIAGSVMLGVGIHKANTKSTCASNDETTAQTGTTQMATTATNPLSVTAKPFYLTVTNNGITGDDLNANFPTAVKKFRKAVIVVASEHLYFNISDIRQADERQSHHHSAKRVVVWTTSFFQQPGGRARRQVLGYRLGCYRIHEQFKYG